ncbi:potassium channel family protein [Streptomyces sp. NPDC029003]|uniref:potassium channel family protein n=1 Tax=Streptomyces sp. NPDC029003 TaxID=3155125 RepID=UPI0034011ACA
MHLAAAMEPGTTAGVLVWENAWAGPFAAAARRSGGQLIANGRQALARTDALCFTVTTFATVGFGDIVPLTQGAKVAVLVQVLGDLLLVGVALKVILRVAQAALGRGNPAVFPPGRSRRSTRPDQSGESSTDNNPQEAARTRTLACGFMLPAAPPNTADRSLRERSAFEGAADPFHRRRRGAAHSQVVDAVSDPSVHSPDKETGTQTARADMPRLA